MVRRLGATPHAPENLAHRSRPLGEGREGVIVLALRELILNIAHIQLLNIVLNLLHLNSIVLCVIIFNFEPVRWILIIGLLSTMKLRPLVFSSKSLSLRLCVKRGEGPDLFHSIIIALSLNSLRLLFFFALFIKSFCSFDLLLGCVKEWILQNVHQQSIVARTKLVVWKNLRQLFLSYQPVPSEFLYFEFVFLQSDVIKDLQ